MAHAPYRKVSRLVALAVLPVAMSGARASSNERSDGVELDLMGPVPTEEIATEAGDSEVDDDAPEASGGCGRAGLGPGLHTGLSLEHDGQQRRFDLYVPKTYDPAVPSPLTLNFHGYMGSAVSQRGFSRFDRVAEPRAMLVAYPHGLGSSWNGEQCCGKAQADDVDDVGFALAVVDRVQGEHCVDRRRVYAVGKSNGGHLGHRLACEAADRFAAVASVTGVLGLDPAQCQPSRPISITQFHGTADRVVPYHGEGPGYPAVPAMMTRWAARNGCDLEPEVVAHLDDVLCQRWPGCSDGVDVTLCSVEGGHHCWPGTGGCMYGPSTDDLQASEVIAKIFDAQRLPR